MNVNFSTHGPAIHQAYERVLSPADAVNWALFGYDRATNDLKVLEMGEGGLVELEEEFDSGKILYAFARVTDPNSLLPKFVFVSWCGDGVPVSKKSLFTMHLADVRERFQGFHVEITARTEEDVMPALILKKVRDSSGAKFSHEQRQVDLPENMRTHIADTGPEKTAPPENKKQVMGRSAPAPPPAVSMVAKPVAEAPVASPAVVASIVEPSAQDPPVVNSASAATQRPRQAPTRPTGPPTFSSEKPSVPPTFSTPKQLSAKGPSDSLTGSHGLLAQSHGSLSKSHASLTGTTAPMNSADRVRRERLEQDRLLMEKERAEHEERERRHREVEEEEARLKQEEAKRVAEVRAHPRGPGVSGGSAIPPRGPPAPMSRAPVEVPQSMEPPPVTSRTAASVVPEQSFPASAPPVARRAGAPPVPVHGSSISPPPPTSSDTTGSLPPPVASRAPSSRPPPPPRAARQPGSLTDDYNREQEQMRRQREEQDAAAAEMERLRIAGEEEAERQRQYEEAERQRQYEEAERQRQYEEAERLRLAEEEAERQRQFEEAERQRHFEEAERQRQYEEAERQRKYEEAERQRQYEQQQEAAHATAASTHPPQQQTSAATLCARVVYDYQAQEDNEVTLYVGELIVDIVQLDPGWWQGSVFDEHAGAVTRTGLFPSNYVELQQSQAHVDHVAQPEHQYVAAPVNTASASVAADSVNAASAGFTVRALYDYTAGEENELTFREGDTIIDVHAVTDDWWSGVGPDGRAGLFPANYVEPVVQ